MSDDQANQVHQVAMTLVNVIPLLGGPEPEQVAWSTAFSLDFVAAGLHTEMTTLTSVVLWRSAAACAYRASRGPNRELAEDMRRVAIETAKHALGEATPGSREQALLYEIVVRATMPGFLVTLPVPCGAVLEVPASVIATGIGVDEHWVSDLFGDPVVLPVVGSRVVVPEGP